MRAAIPRNLRSFNDVLLISKKPPGEDPERLFMAPAGKPADEHDLGEQHRIESQHLRADRNQHHNALSGMTHDICSR
ncbi:hypothetical protein WG908_01130 [Sphingobium sp. AN641]|uniref:hypothetical protein n=1 Tax=Sphingobium sp. AN641 TaxID=3133443 RepID=UPI0030C28930